MSHHQGAIRWDSVADAGFSFAFIKASEGGDFRDPQFEENWLGAGRAGIPAGAYHFFTFCRDGAVQADNFLKALAGASGPMLPPGIDLEFVGNCRKRPSVEELHGELLEFASQVERTLGLAPIFYVTTDFMSSYADAVPEGADVWIRSVFFHPRRTFGRPWVFWQFASRGRVKGISGPVDLDLFGGSKGEWKAFLDRRSRAARSSSTGPPVSFESLG